MTDRRPWVLRMTWRDLCFMHWPVPPALLSPTLPRGVDLDTRGGHAWLGVVPFTMTGVAPRFAPDVPGVSAFPELNLRTYVTAGGVPGVWFYSLDAAQPLAVRLARALFHLPYFDARMWASREQGVTRYASVRTHPGAAPARFAGAYRPVGDPVPAPPGSLEDWLTHRLFLYSADRAGRVYRGRIHHAAWPLRRAEAVIRENTLADALGVSLAGEPHLLHAETLDVRAEWTQRVR
ncbi:hypothetical protein HNQ07_002706 [Deinococcus metalli]|uniref:DUF2071 domain-containing protein n=1 Tax=Deinococcus metalli TaxID=1141878 RepID=A0A7W8KG97_9DEIO|nr:DUF2071 domain-containing protein [Deinococcus metalli]MBB5377233.1 hypothetical protein [Deinococcus metalli]GHF47998.1 hypothetical protein GCM10017781_25430 [Deinococcus metalli]